MTARDEATTFAYKFASAIANLTPGPLASMAASGFGYTMAQAMPTKRAMVERHQRRALGGGHSTLAVRQSAIAAFECYARYWVESFRLPQLSAAEIQGGIRVTGREHLDAGLAAGNGVILSLPHLGGWEWAGRWVADQGMKITVVVEPVQPPELFEWFRALRTELGMTVVPLGPEVGPAVLKALKNNEVLALLSDRDIEGTGIDVEFFGERTKLPAGPARLSLRTGAPILPVAVYFTDGRHGHHGDIRPPLDSTRHGKLRDDVARITQEMAHALEALIRKAPDQWHLFQPNWPSDPGYEEPGNDLG